MPSWRPRVAIWTGAILTLLLAGGCALLFKGSPWEAEIAFLTNAVEEVDAVLADLGDTDGLFDPALVASGVLALQCVSNVTENGAGMLSYELTNGTRGWILLSSGAVGRPTLLDQEVAPHQVNQDWQSSGDLMPLAGADSACPPWRSREAFVALADTAWDEPIDTYYRALDTLEAAGYTISDSGSQYGPEFSPEDLRRLSEYGVVVLIGHGVPGGFQTGLVWNAANLEPYQSEVKDGTIFAFHIPYLWPLPWPRRTYIGVAASYLTLGGELPGSLVFLCGCSTLEGGDGNEIQGEPIWTYILRTKLNASNVLGFSRQLEAAEACSALDEFLECFFLEDQTIGSAVEEARAASPLLVHYGDPSASDSDEAAPTLELECGTPTKSGTVSFSWNAFDNCSSSDELRYRHRLDSNSWTAAWSEATRASFSNLQQGVHVFDVQARDASGNQSEIARCSINVDSPCPPQNGVTVLRGYIYQLGPPPVAWISDRTHVNGVDITQCYSGPNDVEVYCSSPCAGLVSQNLQVGDEVEVRGYFKDGGNGAWAEISVDGAGYYLKRLSQQSFSVMYVVNAQNGTVVQANLDATQATSLGTLGGTLVHPIDIALDLQAGRMYVTSEGNDSVTVANLDGSGGISLGDLGGLLNQPYGIAIDTAAERIYITNCGNDSVVVMNLDGTGAASLGNLGGLLDWPRDIALDLSHGKMYIASADNDRVVVANLDGSEAAILGNLSGAISTPLGIALDIPHGKIYVSNADFADVTALRNTITQANLDGTAAVNLGSLGCPLDRPVGIGVDDQNDRLYVTSPLNNTLCRSELDGTNGTNLGGMEGLLAWPEGIVLAPTPGPMTLSALRAGQTNEH